jgi:excisionase family DNA binding protein
MAGLLTVNETAEVLSVKPSTVRAWIHRGEKLEVVKVGRAVRIPTESVAAFILANTRSPFSSRVLPEEIKSAAVPALGHLHGEQHPPESSDHIRRGARLGTV